MKTMYNAGSSAVISLTSDLLALSSIMEVSSTEGIDIGLLTIGFDKPVSEDVIITQKTELTLTVIRSREYDWPAGTRIARVYTSIDHNAFKENIEDISRKSVAMAIALGG